MPVTSTDFFGGGFFSGGGGGGSSSSTGQWIRFTAALVTVSSTTFVPAGSRGFEIRFTVGTPYSVGATISIGISGSTSLFMATTDINAQLADTYVKFIDAAIGATARAVLVTIAGAPAAGAGVVLFQYATPDV